MMNRGRLRQWMCHVMSLLVLMCTRQDVAPIIPTLTINVRRAERVVFCNTQVNTHV